MEHYIPVGYFKEYNIRGTKPGAITKFADREPLSPGQWSKYLFAEVLRLRRKNLSYKIEELKQQIISTGNERKGA